MRYLYRPHRGGLDESLKETVLCNSEDEIKDLVIESFSHYGVSLTREDVIIDDKENEDGRIGWMATRYVCVTHMGKERFDVPQCVGMCCDEEHLSIAISNISDYGWGPVLKLAEGRKLLLTGITHVEED